MRLRKCNEAKKEWWRATRGTPGGIPGFLRLKRRLWEDQPPRRAQHGTAAHASASRGEGVYSTLRSLFATRHVGGGQHGAPQLSDHQDLTLIKAFPRMFVSYNPEAHLLLWSEQRRSNPVVADSLEFKLPWKQQFHQLPFDCLQFNLILGKASLCFTGKYLYINVFLTLWLQDDF